MSTDSSNLPTDAQLLYEYLGHKLTADGADPPATELLADLEAYRDQLHRLRDLVREAETSLASGQGGELDVDGLMLRVRERLNDKGAQP